MLEASQFFNGYRNMNEYASRSKHSKQKQQRSSEQKQNKTNAFESIAYDVRTSVFHVNKSLND